MNFKKLFFQIGLISICLLSVALQIKNFPYPSPLIKSFLPPKKRWPEMQVRQWIEQKNIDRDFLVFFMRDPPRTPPLGNNIIAPADGLLKPIEEKNGKSYIVIALSFWDVHFTRAPYNGEVIALDDSGDTYMDGEGRDFNFLREKNGPVQKTITLKTDLGEMKVRLITSFAARRIVLFPKIGDKIKQGDKIGHILLGSTVVLELDRSYNFLSRPGEHTIGGETILVQIP